MFLAICRLFCARKLSLEGSHAATNEESQERAVVSLYLSADMMILLPTRDTKFVQETATTAADGGLRLSTHGGMRSIYLMKRPLDHMN